MKQILKRVLMDATGRCWVRKLIVATCSVLVALPAASQPATQVLHGHLPSVVSRLKPIQNLEGSKRVKLAIGLPLRNREALTNLLNELYDPSSTNYHQYLTPEQFTENFGPTEQDYQAVITFARANGLAVDATHPNRMLLEVSGAVADVQKALHVTMRVYRHPTENRTFYAPDTEPSVPSALKVVDVSGLDNYRRPRPRFVIRDNPLPGAGSGPGGNYMGNDFRAAYADGVSLTGTGQTVGLVQFDGYYAADIAAYAQQAGLLNPPTLTNVLLNGFDGIPLGGVGTMEVSLDIEMAMSMAPGLSRIIVYEGSPFNFDPNVVLNRIATDNAAKQISCSWGWTGGPTATTDNIFLLMAANGQTFLAASGDDDAYPAGTLDDPDLFGTPANSAYITSVGGTTLTMAGQGGSWVTETVWNWGSGTGSAGGISTYYPIPTWQQGINMALNQGSLTMRNIPDVAMTADDIFVIANNGLGYIGVGGTSCAAPLWAGFIALANQQGANKGMPPVGFINPAVYAIGKGPNYTSCFHDITTGNNTSPSSPNLFYGVVGYDLCTGWGTPIGQNLINALAPLARSGLLQMSVVPPSGSALIASANQPVFVTVSDVFAITNATVTASIPGVVTNLTFRNDGASPDARARDGVYSATIQAPASGAITMTVTATAPAEVGITNSYFYTVVSVPQNDNFANAAKVSAAGATYLSNNRFATIEPGEPDHAGVTNKAASLWWNWTPAASASTFVDTTGSAFDTVLAVYTGTTLSNLTQVAATNDVGAARQAYLKFNATGGTTYHIVVAGANASATNSLRLAITPGGEPDTNRPSVVVTSPLSGLWWSNKFITVSGTANDPQPNASGLSQVLLTVNNQWQFTASGTTNWSTLVALSPDMKNGLNKIQVTAQDVAGNISSPVNIQIVYFVANPPNDLFAEAILLTLTNGASYASAITTNASKQAGEPDITGNVGGKSAWWTFTPPSDGVLTLDTAGSSFDTLLGLYLGANVANLTTIAENDDASAFLVSSLISQAVRSGQVYHITVDGYNGASGTAFLNYSFTNTAVYHLTTSTSGGGAVQVTNANPLGGVAVMPGAAGDFAGNSTVVLTPFPDAYYQFDGWSGDVGSSDNPLSIVITKDLNITGNFVPVQFTDGFESGNLAHLPWTTAGSASWFVQSSVVRAGQCAARSGFIGNSQSSSLILATNFLSGIGSFDYLTSSETNFDSLAFYVDGVLLERWSGAVGWETYTFSLTNGAHVLEWRYTKDASLSSGLDAAFIDDVNLPLAGPLGAPALAHLQFTPQSGGGFMLDLQGQINQQYVVQTSTNLVHWVNISTNVAFDGFVHLLVSSGANHAQFYRAVVAP